ncbi:hypothetical protein COO60DRAFT_1475939 [Scenedesmus sp. NREL 46B-D3]|nr:hypothetical protein COO60DRAFT_1475939 [Scenedesmus sp. NREL 46B-D3]
MTQCGAHTMPVLPHSVPHSVDSPEKPPWEPNTCLRGETTTRRFELPKNNMTLNTNGSAIYGIDEKPMRRIISHDFEQQMKLVNSASHDRQCSKPQGQRFAAATEWQQQHQLQRSQQAAEEDEKQAQHTLDSLAGILHQLPEYHTSKANPLAARPHTAADADDAAEASGSCADASNDGGVSRPLSPEMAEKVQRAHGQNGHLATGSLEPVPSPDDAEEQARLQKERALLTAALAEECRKQKQVEQLERQLLLEYPHGLPKRLQRELMQLGLQLPSLGFGCAHSVPSRESAYTSMR